MTEFTIVKKRWLDICCVPQQLVLLLRYYFCEFVTWVCNISALKRENAHLQIKKKIIFITYKISALNQVEYVQGFFFQWYTPKLKFRVHAIVIQCRAHLYSTCIDVVTIYLDSLCIHVQDHHVCIHLICLFYIHDVPLSLSFLIQFLNHHFSYTVTLSPCSPKTCHVNCIS